MNPKIKKIIGEIFVKDNIAKTALLWTGIFILIFWMIIQESGRIDLQEKVNQLGQSQEKVNQLEQENIMQLENESKRIDYSRQISILKEKVNQLEQKNKDYPEQLSALQERVKQLKEVSKSYSEPMSALQERVKQLEREISEKITQKK